jgi:hypothetical protein
MDDGDIFRFKLMLLTDIENFIGIPCQDGIDEIFRLGIQNSLQDMQVFCGSYDQFPRGLIFGDFQNF